MKKILILVALCLGISGCAPQIVYRTKYAYLPAPTNLLQDTKTPAPSYTPQEYANLSCDAKEKFWTNYTLTLYGVIGKANGDKAGLRTWNDSLQKQVADLNKKADDGK